MAKRSKLYLNRRSIITRSVLIEKIPFMVSCNEYYATEKYLVRNWEYDKEFYLITEGMDSGCVVHKVFCTRLSKKM
jgi:hypothetical protein